MNMKRVLAIAFCLVLLVGALSGCSKAASRDEGYYNSAAGSGAELGGSGSDSSGSSNVLTDRKLIRKINVSAETEDMDVLLENVNDRIAQLGGYIESRDVENGSAYDDYRDRSATLVIRIPAENLDAFLQQINQASNVVSTRETSDDITLQYVDTESRLKVLRTEEERLLEFLSQAQSVSEMLEIEARLTEIQSQIESLVSQLNTYDNLVDYGTVTLEIIEVEVYTVVEEEEPTMWEEIGQGFMNSLRGVGAIGRGLLVFILSASPYLVILGGIGVVAWLIIRRKRRR